MSANRPVWDAFLPKVFHPKSPKDAWIGVDPALSQKVKDLMALCAPATASAIDKHMRPVYENAFAKWPVRRQKSKDSKGKTALEYTVSGGVFKASLVNRSPYAYFINGNKTAQDLILKPGKEAAKKIGLEAAEEIARRAGTVK